MSRPTADVALVTDRRYTATAAAPGDWYLANILADDDLLRAALARHGMSSVRVDWSDDAPDEAFTAVMEQVLDDVRGHVVDFPNPLTGGRATNGVYVGRRAR